MRINSKSSLVKFLTDDNKKSMVYRGQREASWQLESTILRAVKSNPLLKGREKAAEKAVIDSFNRNGHLYDPGYRNFNTSARTALTYIQHHGAPTKLIDFTSSKFIALFFAFDSLDMSTKDKYVRMWMFDKVELHKKTAALISINDHRDLYTDNEAAWNKYIEPNTHEAIFIVEPEINSKRSHIQKGCFICSGKIEIPLNDLYLKEYTSVIKYVDIHKSLQRDVFILLQDVNICHRTLYGGIEGFCKDVNNTFPFLGT